MGASAEPFRARSRCSIGAGRDRIEFARQFLPKIEHVCKTNFAVRATRRAGGTDILGLRFALRRHSRGLLSVTKKGEAEIGLRRFHFGDEIRRRTIQNNAWSSWGIIPRR
jgi:hypothetical protein